MTHEVLQVISGLFLITLGVIGAYLEIKDSGWLVVAGLFFLIVFL